jgi:hypothetical protein
MKRIEVVMSSPAMDRFKDLAIALGLSQVDVAVPAGSRVEWRRLSEGQRFSVDALAKTTVKFPVADQDAIKIFHALVTTLHADSISIFKIDKADALDRRSFSDRSVRSAVGNGFASNSAPSSEHLRPAPEAKTPMIIDLGNHRFAY